MVQSSINDASSLSAVVDEKEYLEMKVVDQ